MQTAATWGQDGSSGSGRRAFAASERTVPTVSAPSSVVRSTMRIARSSAHFLAVVLIDRVPSMAARASAPTSSTPGRPCSQRRSPASSRVTSSKRRSAVVVTPALYVGWVAGPRSRAAGGHPAGGAPDGGRRKYSDPPRLGRELEEGGQVPAPGVGEPDLPGG